MCKDLLGDVLRLLPLMACSHSSLAAEILFLRKQRKRHSERDDLCCCGGMSEEEGVTGRRRRRSAAEIEQIKNEYASSGMKQREFCRSRGLSLSALQRYLKGQRRKPKTACVRSRLLTVEVAASASGEAKSHSGVSLVLGEGRKVEVERGFDESTLCRLVAVLERG
jgi:hypothetical protein